MQCLHGQGTRDPNKGVPVLKQLLVGQAWEHKMACLVGRLPTRPAQSPCQTEAGPVSNFEML